MSGECQVNIKSQSELDIGGRETCFYLKASLNPNPVLSQIQNGEVSILDTGGRAVSPLEKSPVERST